MVNYCSICKASGLKGYFNFPKGPRRADYLRIAGLPTDSEVKGLRVCFRHFQEKDLVVVGNQVRIRKGE